MQRQIFKNQNGSNIKGNLPKGHLNGLMLVLKPTAGGYFTKALMRKLVNIQIRAKFQAEKTHHLIAGLPLSIFTALTNIDYGSNGDLSRIVNSGALEVGGVAVSKSADASADTREDTVWNYSIKSDAVTIYIDLGSIYCDNGNEFLFELDNVSDFNISAYTISEDFSPFGFIKYDIDFDLNENYKAISKAYIYTDTIDKDFSIFVESDEDNYETDFDGLRAFTQIFGNVENIGAGVLTSVWQSKHDVPQDVWLKLTNNDITKPLQSNTTSLGIVTVRLEFPTYLIMKQEHKNKASFVQLVKNLEVNNPSLAQPMIKVGMLPSSKALKRL